MSESTSIQINGQGTFFVRGAVVAIASEPLMRVTRSARCTLTVRPLHTRSWVESLHFAWERFVKWPIRDLLTQRDGA